MTITSDPGRGTLKAARRLLFLNPGPDSPGGQVDRLRRLTETCGMHFQTVETSADALTTLSEEPVDVVFVYLRSSVELLEQLASLLAHPVDVAVIALIDSDESLSLGRRAIHIGADAFLDCGNLRRGEFLRAMDKARINRKQRNQQRAADHLLQENFRDLIECSSDCTIVISPNLIILYANAATERLFGQNRRQLVGRNFGCPIVAGEVSDIEIVTPAGDIRTAEMRVSRTLWHGETCLIASLRDVTEQKRAERRFQENHELLNTLLDTDRALVHILDVEGRIVQINRFGLNLLGYEEADVIGGDWFSLAIPEAQCESRRDRFHRALDGDVYHGEVHCLRTRGGEEVPVRYYQSIVRDSDGDVIGLLSIGYDITEDIRKEERLRQAQKMESLGVLAGGLAHDFNNLLVGILGNAELALMDIPDESPLQELIQGISGSATRAAELTNQMLAYSGKGRYVIKPFHLSSLVRDMGKLLRSSISPHATLHQNLREDLPATDVDVAQIRQVVMNLILNASEALKDEAGEIHLQTDVRDISAEDVEEYIHDESFRPGTYVELIVRDTGCGMDEQTRKKLFEPFFTTKFTGRGLGMSAVLGIVRGHQGAIRVQSTPGKGTMFSLLLPASEEIHLPEEASNDQTRPEPQAPKKKSTILVVDDEENVRTMERIMLERVGYNIVAVEDGLKAIQHLRDETHAIDAVILDLTMPVMSGEDAFQEIRQLRPDLPVFLCSGYSQQDAEGRFGEKGLSGFIQKPFRVEELVSTLQTVLDD